MAMFDDSRIVLVYECTLLLAARGLAYARAAVSSNESSYSVLVIVLNSLVIV